MGHIAPPLPLLPPMFCQGPPKARTEWVAGHGRPEFPSNRLGDEYGRMDRPPKKPKVRGDLWIVGVLPGAIAVVIGALLLLVFSQGRELEAPENPAKSVPAKDLSHKP